MKQPPVFDLTGPLPTGTTVLEASAGTGKTYAIAALATRFIAEGRVTLAQLMLVTFSRAATQELRIRVRDRLEATRAALQSDSQPGADDPVARLLWEVEGPERERRADRLAAALADFDAATIATTHEFCHRMLAGLGTLAPADPLARFVEDLGPEIHDAVLDRYVARYADVPPHDRPFPPADAERWVRAVYLQPGIEVGPAGVGDVPGARVEFCCEVRDLVERRKRERGILSYDDMLTRLAEALRDPHTGQQAARRLSARFPVVLIDEFQDTDPVQWEIVRRAFQGRSTVVLIGDPKQAIYGFRGADVFSYLAAVRSTASVATLDTNHRSDERLVDAVGALLGGAELGEAEIVVRPVAATQPLRLQAPAPWSAPLRIRTLTPADPDDFPSAAQMRARVQRDLVEDIGRLLASGATLTFGDETRPVCPRDIAVLVARNARGEEIRQALLAAGIPAVFAGTESVYRSEAAQQWLTLLRALEEQDPSTMRSAALTGFVGWRLRDLVAEDDSQLTELSARMRRWAAVLADGGLAALVEVLWNQTAVAERLLQHEGGERLLTDLRHLAQNLETAERAENLRLPGLVAWLRDRIDEARMEDVDDRTRRLETDAQAVQISSVHRSKGLEFPIVYLPQAGDRYQALRDEGEPFVVHLPGEGTELRRVIDVGGIPARREERDERRARFARHVEEDAGDDLRKLYVALTRAQCQVTCWWAPTKANLAASALQRVLFRPPVGAPAASYADTDLAPARERLRGSGIEFQEVDAPRPAPAADRGSAEPLDLRAASFTRTIDQQWRRTSYSGLTAGAHGLAPVDLNGREPDEPESVEAADAPAFGDAPSVPVASGAPRGPESAAQVASADPRVAAPVGAENPAGSTQVASSDPARATQVASGAPDLSVAARLSPLASLPGGTQFGSLVHAIFEYLDPGDADLEGALRDHARRWLARYPVAGVGVEDLVTALQPALLTPLGPLTGGCALVDIPLADRLAELEFEMPLGSPRAFATLAGLADIIGRHLPADDPLAAYPAMLRAQGLGEQTLRGFLTGSIDALLRVAPHGDDPRFVVVDYKTNRLGAPGTPLTLGDYSRDAMAQAMMESHYPLQALLYGVATHRFLRWRLSGYEPDSHLGGVLYLFVRGMGGPDAVGPQGHYGVFEWTPAPALIVELSDALGGLR